MDSFIEGFLHICGQFTSIKITDSSLRLMGETVGAGFVLLILLLITILPIYCFDTWRQSKSKTKKQIDLNTK